MHLNFIFSNLKKDGSSFQHLVTKVLFRNQSYTVPKEDFGNQNKSSRKDKRDSRIVIYNSQRNIINPEIVLYYSRISNCNFRIVNINPEIVIINSRKVIINPGIVIINSRIVIINSRIVIINPGISNSNSRILAYF